MSNLPPTEAMTPERQTLEKLKALKASFDSQPKVSMWDHEGWLRKKKAYESSLIHTADALFAELERAWASEAALREELARAREDKERLDWIEQTGDNGEIVINGDLITERQIAAWNVWGTVKTPRAAIDAAKERG